MCSSGPFTKEHHTGHSRDYPGILCMRRGPFSQTLSGFPQNVSTRSEVTRWFGVSIFYTLYMADILISGIDNNFGVGIIPFRDAWFCDNTSHVTPGYLSLEFLDLCLMLLVEMMIVSHTC